MVISHHIIRAHTNERVASLRREAVTRPESCSYSARRSSLSRRRRGYRAQILGLRRVAR